MVVTTMERGIVMDEEFPEFCRESGHCHCTLVDYETGVLTEEMAKLEHRMCCVCGLVTIID